mgnify:CR=1 FL=1
MLTKKWSWVIYSLLLFFLSCQPYIRPSYWCELNDIKNDSFKISVKRNINSDSDSILIAKAEGNYPDITTITTSWYNRDSSIGTWWYEKFDDVNIPWAITDSSVKYYVDFVTNAMHPVISFGGRLEPVGASLVYDAKVAFYEEYVQTIWVTNKKDTLVERIDTIYYWYNPADTIWWEKISTKFHNVSVVTMILDFDAGWGPLAAVGFTKPRITIFDENGKILRVYGDGKTGYWVS